MNLTREQKKEKAAELANEIKQAGGFFFASYQGLKFIELAQLRQRLATGSCKIKVVRNSIARHALKSAGLEIANEAALKGPVAIALFDEKKGDVVETAKTFANFAKEKPALKMRAGYSANSWFDEKQCIALSRLLGRRELTCQLAGSLYTCVSKMASVAQAPIRDFAFVLKALEDKKKAVAAA